MELLQIVYTAVITAVMGGLVAWTIGGAILVALKPGWRKAEALRRNALTPEERAQEDLEDWANSNAW